MLTLLTCSLGNDIRNVRNTDPNALRELCVLQKGQRKFDHAHSNPSIECSRNTQRWWYGGRVPISKQCWHFPLHSPTSSTRHSDLLSHRNPGLRGIAVLLYLLKSISTKSPVSQIFIKLNSHSCLCVYNMYIIRSVISFFKLHRLRNHFDLCTQDMLRTAPITIMMPIVKWVESNMQHHLTLFMCATSRTFHDPGVSTIPTSHSFWVSSCGWLSIKPAHPPHSSFVSCVHSSPGLCLIVTSY